MLDIKKIDNNWTLFLDRDGVINHEKHLDYIYNYEEFIFYEGVKEALAQFAKIFKYIFIATNQRGVGKGLMSEQDLLELHAKMMADISEAGGKIDGIYYCTSLSNDDPDRKPKPGMAFKARQKYPDIDFSKSIMVGNNISDMEFGRNAGMNTVFLKTTQPDLQLPHPAVDLDYNSLLNFAEAVNIARNLY